VLLAAFVTFCKKWFVARTRQVAVSESSHSVVGFLLIALLGVLAHNMIDYNLQFVGIAFPFWIALGMLAGIGAAPSVRLSNVNNKFIHYIELCIAVFLLLVALREGIYLVTSSIGRHAEAKGHALVALDWYDRSKGEWFSRDLHLSREHIFRDHPEEDYDRFPIEDYFDQNKEDPRAWKVLGRRHELRGEYTDAVSAYRTALALGQWNDIGILLGLIEASFVWDEEEESKVRNALRKEFDPLLMAYSEAIERNAHFIALSHNVEDFIRICELFAIYAPNEEAPRYEVLAAKADYHGRIEREKVQSRPPGYLW